MVVASIDASTPADIESADTVLGSEAPGDAREAELERYEDGDQVGPFTIVNILGEGGMGLVYTAYDPRLDRNVALKLLRPDRHSGERTTQGRRRLLREAQALAKLSHENVVVVHETGEFEGQIYVAMEYVRGGTLRDWERDGDHPWQDVVAMYCRAGRGLLAAHDAGLVHRDFKPDNVLVGDDGRVRVTDFGLVRGTAAPEEIDTPDERRARFPTAVPLSGELTRHGVVVGTPGYVAPELYRKQPADARSDQYAFCVSLYEALYGEKPFEGDSLAEIALSQCNGRIKPPPPDAGVPDHILELLHRGIAVDPAERFDSMAELLDALEPAPKRTITPLALGVGIAVAAGIATVVVLLLARGPAKAQACADAGHALDRVWNRERRAAVAAALASKNERLARDTRTRVLRSLDTYASDWVGMRRETCEATHVRGEQSEQALDLRMACLDRRLAELDTVATTLTKNRDDRTARNAVHLTSALTDLTGCADVARLKSREATPDDPQRARKATALEERIYATDLLSRAGHKKRALKRSAHDLARARTLGWPRTLALALLSNGNLLEEMGKPAEARKRFAEALPLAGKARDDVLVAQLHINLLGVLRHKKANLERMLSMKPIIEAAISRAGDPPSLRVRYLHYLASAYDGAGKYDAALKLYRQALDLSRRKLGPRHRFTTRAINNVAVVLDIQGKTKQAIELYKRGLALEEQRFGKHHPRVARALNNLAVALAAIGDNKGAETRYRRALAIWRQTYAAGHSMIGITQLNLGVVLQAQKRWAAAETAYRGAIQAWQHATGRTREYLATALNNLGDLHEERNRCGRALRNYRRALKVWEATLGDNHPDLAYALLGIGSCRIKTGGAAQAIEPLERALRLRSKARVDADDIAEVQFALARALAASKRDRKRAVGLAKAALAQYEKSKADGGSKARKVSAWLATRR